ncbi:hypothetical protein [Paractinoplanes durhamensis]|uniref:Heparinase n=1 Tax=Paractinoplanes durhamensis TaxID=113563 RepID=A0ABQ3Z789_9ACTN|nr:hypothetical protein [Actinoplanes durhamensis]GIE05631.1 hypothetical protein Adu01nite_69810 [Actinoplanes durhamensis]
MAETDEALLGAVRAGLDDAVRSIVAEAGGDTWRHFQHRRLAERITTLVAAWRADPGREPELLGHALRLAELLRERQGPTGLFRGGDNVDSPPDSAFSVNDLADAAMLLAGADRNLAAALRGLLAAATPALLAGGVHTPNHRWELAAALGRLYRLEPRPELAARVSEWLAEGIDLDDGLYSERSPNYAAHVSNPSLLLIAAVFDRPELITAVEQNLAATLDLLLPDGTVETVLSRRQDQNRPFRLAPFLLPLRRVALLRDRGDLSWAAGLALAQGIDAPGHVAAQLLLDPELARLLPPPVAPARPRVRHFPAAGTLVAHHPRVSTVVFGGSDYARHRRIRSGLANSPTLLRMVAGAAVLDSVRLSRVFFGLGPFRADGLTLEFGAANPGAANPGAAAILRESVSASYYQPLAPSDRRVDARYELGDDGRFSAAMAFDRRERDDVTLRTEIRVEPGETGTDLVVEVSGPAVEWCLELAFRPGGKLTGATRRPDGRGWQLALPAAGKKATARYRVGDDELVVTVDGPPAESGEPGYHPGEEYEFLGGTDAASGELLYVCATAPARLRMRITAI